MCGLLGGHPLVPMQKYLDRFSNDPARLMPPVERTTARACLRNMKFAIRSQVFVEFVIFLHAQWNPR